MSSILASLAAATASAAASAATPSETLSVADPSPTTDPAADPSGDQGNVFTDAEFTTAVWALITPFIVIPAAIIAVRLVKYAWKIYQAKKYGYDNDLFEDPLAELGLKIRRGYENTTEIRKIRKEQRMLKAAMQQRAKMNEMAILEPDAQSRDPQAGADKVIKAFPPLQAARQYIDTIRRQTRRTWADKLSPDAVRRWISVSRYARAWMVFQVFCTILAIINYVMLTYLVHYSERNERKLIKNLDLFYAAIFLLDYALSFYTAEDRLRFYIHYLSLIDLLSIVSPFVFVLITSDTKFVWFVGLIRIFRATRILRTYRILAFSQSEETRELTAFVLNFANFIFFSASVINATESLVVTWNKPASLLNWHDSLYYIMVTFSTIGFGDLTPSSTISRVIVMFLIILVIVYVPYQTGKILELYNSLSRYQRASHQPSSSHPHVILSGSITASGLIDFCREYFIADLVGSIVILHTEEPDIEIRRLLNHPFYRNRLIYLRGSPISIPDLRRAAAQYSTALFLLNATSNGQLEEVADLDEGQELKKARGMDAQVLMQALVAKNGFPGLPIFAQVQDVRSKDLSTHCGCDRILCIDEIKMSLMATNCVVPGIQTLILNLIHSYKELENSMLSDFWMQEYQCGVANQVYTFKVPGGIVGMRFYDAVREIYASFGAIVFGLITSNAGFNRNPVRLHIDRDYRIKGDDVAFCISDGGDETILRICLYFKDAYRKTDLDRRDLEKEMADVIGTAERDGQSTPITALSLADVTASSDFEELAVERPPLGTIPEGISGHIILCGHMTARAVRQFVTSVCEADGSAALGIGDNLEQAGLHQPATSPNAGSARKNDPHLASAVKPLPRVPVVCIAETLPEVSDAGIWSEILSHGNVHVLQGTPIKKTSLILAGVTRCLRIVVFANTDACEDSASSSGSIPDSQALFIVKMLQREWPHVQFLVELVDGSNVKYFSARNLEWDTNNLRMQSILNNYALSLGDRLELYRKVRAENAEQSSIWFQLVQLVIGPDGQDGKRATTSSQAIKRSDSRNPEQRRHERRFTRSAAVKQAERQGDYDVLKSFADDYDAGTAGPDDHGRMHNKRQQLHGDDAIADAEDDSDSSNDKENAEEPEKAEVTITEAYLQRLLEEAELNESGLSPYPVYHFDRHFAAGMVATSSFMYSLLCQSYFRPYIVDIVRSLIGSVVHLPVSNSCVGKPYIQLVNRCLDAGFIPIGLYRRGARLPGSPGSRTQAQSPSSQIFDVDSMPYVYTNCRAGDIVQEFDLVFAIQSVDGPRRDFRHARPK